MSLRSVPPFHWRHSHLSFIANQFSSGKSWYWIIHLVPPYMGKIPQDGVNEQIWHISSLVVLHWIRPHTRVQRIYFLFNFYLAHTFFSVFFNSKNNLFSYIFLFKASFLCKIDVL